MPPLRGLARAQRHALYPPLRRTADRLRLLLPRQLGAPRGPDRACGDARHPGDGAHRHERCLRGAPRFFMAAKKAGVKAIIGAELVLEETPERRLPGGWRSGFQPLPARGRMPRDQPAGCRRSIRSQHPAPSTQHSQRGSPSSSRAARVTRTSASWSWRGRRAAEARRFTWSCIRGVRGRAALPHRR